MRGRSAALVLCLAAMVACRGGTVSAYETCKPADPPDAAKATTHALEGGLLLPNGRELRPIGTQVAAKQLGYPVDVIGHPLRPIVYVSDIRHGGDKVRCNGGPFPRGIHVVNVGEDGGAGELQNPSDPDGRDAAPGAKGLPGNAKCGDDSLPKDAGFGLAIDRCGRRLYASSGVSGYVHVYAIEDEGRRIRHEKAIQVGGYTAGLAFSPDETDLYVVTFAAVNFGPSQVRRIRLATFALDDFDAKLDKPGGYALATTPEPNGGVRVWVTGFRDGDVATFIADTDHKVVPIHVGKNPQDVIARTGSSSVIVSVSDADKLVELKFLDGRIVKVAEVAIGADYCGTGNCPRGSSPTGLIEDPVTGDIYVVREADNAVSVVTRNTKGELDEVKSFPVGWTPTQLALVPRSEQKCEGDAGQSSQAQQLLVVANAKTPYGAEAPVADTETTDAGATDASAPYENREIYYDSTKMQGSLSVVSLHDPENPLVDHKPEVDKHITLPVGVYPLNCENKAFPVPLVPGRPTPIRHVVLIVRENKTYDFVLGDLGEGNGHPDYAVDYQRAKLKLSPVTENIHALARSYANLDNFYADGQISMQGHAWLTASFVNDYLERFHVEETGGGVLNLDIDQEPGFPAAYPGFDNFFAHLLAHNTSFLIFNELVGLLSNKGGAYVVNHAVLEAGFQDKKSSDIERVKTHVIKRLIENDDFPAFTYVLLARDHTFGVSPGQPTPAALIAENDYATGLLVEAISNSKYWDSTAIFIVQDDAQQGYDHVDYHRTLCVIVSPWAKRGTSSVHASFPALFRTIEHILGLPPMNRFDAHAPLLVDAFQAIPNSSGRFKAIPPLETLLKEVSPPVSSAAEHLSQGVEDEDLDQSERLGDIVWWSLTGEQAAWERIEREARLQQARGRSRDDER